MSEQQDVEYKSSWHDDYLKWVCGFANSGGGRMYIGMNDVGKVVGIADHRKQMDEIPNKVKSTMGITVRVNLLEEDGKKYVEVVVPSYSVPVSFRGRFYCRSGSVNQELTGPALNEFVIERLGNTWDDMIESRATFDDIDERTVKAFIHNAEKAGRIPDIFGISTEELFEKLRLVEDGHLKRAAIVLFGKDPGRFYPSTFVKIGKFDDDDFTIRHQEMEDGNIIFLLDAVLRQLDNKFLIRSVSFEGMNRIETPEYPIEALREMILNSLVHRNYLGVHSQLRVYEDKLFLWNDGGLPRTITMAQLMGSHGSHPRNPTLARACFMGGFIDAWGSGISKIIGSCEAAGLPTPEIEETEGGFKVTLFKGRFSKEHLVEMGLNERQIRAVMYVRENGRITSKEYQELNNISKRTSAYELADLVEKHKLLRRLGASTGIYYEKA